MLPQDSLKPGNIVCLRSKLAGKCLRTLEGGVLDCGGDQGSACEFDPLILVLITGYIVTQPPYSENGNVIWYAY